MLERFWLNSSLVFASVNSKLAHNFGLTNSRVLLYFARQARRNRGHNVLETRRVIFKNILTNFSKLPPEKIQAASLAK